MAKPCRARGHPGGTASEIEETLRFAALAGVRPTADRFPSAETY
jgi:hypothetical protein